MIALFLQASVIIFFQVAFKEIFDGVAEKKHIGFIITWIFLILGSTVLRILIGLLIDYLVGNLTLKIFGKIRILLFDQLEWFPLSFFQKVHVGEIVSHYSHDLQHSEMVTRQVLPLFVRSIFLALLSLIILFFFNWQLTLFALALFPFVLLGVLLFMKKARDATSKNQEANAKLATMMEEVASQHLLLQAFNLQKNFLDRFKQNVFKYEKEFLGGIFLRTLVGRTSIFGLSIVEILIFSAGAIMAYHGMMTIGTLFGFFALIWNISGAVSTTADVLPNLIEASSQMTRLQTLLLEKTDRPLPSENKEIKEFKEKISFRDVTLQQGKRTLLKNVTLEIKKGQFIGLVGSTGSGKSTLLSLLMGFYSPSSGEIAIDGIPLNEIDKDCLRDSVGIVFQHTPLFNLSLGENIAIGDLSKSFEEIVEAAKKAEIHTFISSLPMGYDTIVKQYGTNLSGGQKQRIALARLYLRDPSIYLLDEPTSALDPLVEQLIHETIVKLSKEKTIIMSTHRLSTLVEADQIFVFDGGELIESGTHTTLLEKKGTYFRLWNK